MLADDNGPFILHNQYIGWWWPGDVKSWKIGPVLPEYSGIATRRVKVHKIVWYHQNIFHKFDFNFAINWMQLSNYIFVFHL